MLGYEVGPVLGEPALSFIVRPAGGTATAVESVVIALAASPPA